jgi:hypothetical protein
MINQTMRPEPEQKILNPLIENLEQTLFEKVMAFEINLGHSVDFPIEARYTMENTNDMGEPLAPQTS